MTAVVFDMDGLLLDTERLYFDAYRAARTHHALPPDDALFLSLVGLNTTLSTTRLAQGLAGQIDPDRFNATWNETCVAALAGGIPAKPGAADLARHLQTRDIPYIIATSTQTDRAHHHLDRAGLGPLFPQIVGGDQVARSKPAPDIYLKAAEMLGRAPDTCIAFEDSENGVRAALAAGCQTVQIPDVVPPSDALRAMGHHIAPDLLSGAHHMGLMRKEPQ